ncbi:hypothetical protein [Sporolactobacillus putidus]|uniref:Uncharacterized protein n=1 Tax=Sporolactobacillus putidus TaxID=492735 RepID=A0A917S1W8_9BACL|nr:hypothetical protein [Sporolactobacillus putidus]GGL47482.1 hypothetical protein GCM10007968_09450 [Sporolactobacillus putidus]
MSVDLTSSGNSETIKKSGWFELVRKEDWRAVWIGLFLVFLGVFFWLSGSSIKVLTAQIPKWNDLPTLAGALSARLGSIFLLYLTFLIFRGNLS